MGVPAHLHRYTFTEHLDLEQASNVKHEYLDGEIYGILYVSQDEVVVERRHREEGGPWTSTRHGAGETVVLDAIGCRLEVTGLFRDVPPG